MNVYFISGLGVDERIFTNIYLPEPFRMKFIKWIDPFWDDDITTYSKKLLSQIDQTAPVVLVGLSFGGMIAVEIANMITVKKTILFSSVPTSKQFPWYFRAIRICKLYNIAPIKFIRRSNRILFFFLGIKTHAQKLFFKSIHNDANYKFVRWAIHAALGWKRKSNSFHPVQIHGTADKIFPVKYIQADYLVKGAGHFMIFNNAELVTKYLVEELRDLE
jgi:pimeloyl-ACP methyl ester carboxylesterase